LGGCDNSAWVSLIWAGYHNNCPIAGNRQIGEPTMNLDGCDNKGAG